ncbi:hypothetical protein [Palleronia sp.]|uniref:hypothetical protein n=1 Tax=Palleronia sp. TaxID=1940284 RepID=UPI0035C8673A
MMPLRTALLAFFAISAAPALADDVETEARDYLTGHGFETIEMSRDSGMLTAIATGKGKRIEVRYNAATGEILSQEMTMLSDERTPDES